jgi:sec-independent protein translocase protein TatA
LLLLVVLLLFGAKRLPELGQSLGTSMRAFKDSVDGAAERHLPEAPAPGSESATAAAQGEQQPQVPAGH